MADSPMVAAATELFREAFEGAAPGKNYTYFAQGRECLFATIESLTAEQASQRLPNGVSSIAAHTDHVRYYIHLANQDARGVEEASDWEGSWRNQTVDDAAWSRIRMDLRKDYEELMAWLVKKEEPQNFNAAVSILAQVAHAAFHLGAMRQILKATQPSINP